jgi:membrane-bound serine protease (ClpP class)
MIVMVVVGLLAVVIELFVPAGGVIGVLGGLSMIGGVVLTYQHIGPGVGTLFLISCLLLTPALVMLAFKIFPHTYMGKLLIMKKVLSAKAGYQSADPDLTELEGKEGQSLTVLRPSGMARFDKMRVSVVTDGEMIEKGKKIRVVHVEGNRIVVERV